MSKEHLNLPKTAFSMKANLPNKEPEYLKYWDKINLYEKLRSQIKFKNIDQLSNQIKKDRDNALKIFKNYKK